MDLVDAVINIWITISNWFGQLIRSIWDLFSWIVSFFNYALDIISALFFGFGSLLSWIWDLIAKVFDWGVFVNVWRCFDILSDYIWWPATVFIATLLLVIVFRIFIAFIFKILRLNIDYHNTQSKTKTLSQHENLK